VASIVLVASEAVASTRDVSLDGNAAAGVVADSTVTFQTGSLGPGSHTLTGILVDAAGNAGAFELAFTVKVEAQAMFELRLGKPKARTQGDQKLFSVPLRLSAPARVKATLLSPTGRKVRTVRTSLPAGAHSVRFAVPVASLPPGRYTILVVATAADRTKVTKRVQLTIPAGGGAVRPGAAGADTPKTALIAVPVVPPDKDEPAKPEFKPEAAAAKPATPPVSSKPAPKVSTAIDKPLETASRYVGSNPHRTIGLIVVLMMLGAAIAFLIRVELARMLSPRG
jgi:hypothetical protein